MISGLLRIGLALLVVLHHLSRFGVGRAAVYIFFALSGYWVARMWNEKYRAGKTPWRTFVLARFLRIWPLFLITNIAAMLMFEWLGQPVPSACSTATVLACAHSLVGNSFLLGYSLMEGRALGPAWSLDVELQFYLVAPLILLMLQGSRRSVALVTATLVVVALADCYFLPGDALPQYLPFFVVGVLAATHKIALDRRTAVLSAAAVGGALLLGLATPLGRDVLLTGANPTALASFNDAYNVLLALLAIPGALYLAARERGSKGAALGDIAFVIYIVHWIPVTLVNHYFGHLPALARLPYVAGAVLATIGLSVVVWKLIDQPMQAWRRTLADVHPRPPVRAGDPELARRVGRK